MKKKDYIASILGFGTFFSFTALVVTVLLQVVTRFALPQYSFIWTEEAARFFFIYSVAFAAPLAMKKREYVNVDLVLNVLPKNARKVFDIIIDLFSVALFIMVFFQAIKFAKLGIGQTSPAMRIPMYIGFSSIIFLTTFVSYYAIINFINRVHSSLGEGEAEERGDLN